MSLPSKLQDRFRKELTDVRTEADKALVALSLLFGWTRSASRKGVTICPPDGGKQICIDDDGTSNINVYQSNLKAVISRGEPENNAPVVALVDMVLGEFKLDAHRTHLFDEAASKAKPAKRKVAAKPVPAVVIELPADPPSPAKGQRPVSPKHDDETLRPVASQHMAEPAKVVGPAGAGPRRIINRHPWREGDEDGKRRDVVIERVWSDGTKDYACAWSGCDRTSENPLSISSHHSHHTRKAEKAAEEANNVIPLPTLEEAEQLPVDEILKRVAILVAPTLVKQIGDLSDRLLAVEGELATVREEAKAANDRADKAESRWKTFKELVTEEEE